jgi:hypothetical protein
MVIAFGSLGSLKRVIASGVLLCPFACNPKSNPAPGVILSGLGRFAVNSTGKRPLSISQFDVVVDVHCRVFNSRK